MSGLDRYRSDDRRALEALYRRTLGAEAAERLKLTWQWERRQNPGARGAEAPWVVREGTALVGSPRLAARCASRWPATTCAARGWSIRSWPPNAIARACTSCWCAPRIATTTSRWRPA